MTSLPSLLVLDLYRTDRPADYQLPSKYHPLSCFQDPRPLKHNSALCDESEQATIFSSLNDQGGVNRMWKWGVQNTKYDTGTRLNQAVKKEHKRKKKYRISITNPCQPYLTVRIFYRLCLCVCVSSSSSVVEEIAGKKRGYC